VLLHSDMIQSFGKQPVRATDAAAISITAHKFHGPKGVGLLVLRAGISIAKIQFGGSHENERRPGTENVAAIAGLARAAELAVVGMEAEQARQAALRDRLWEGIRAAFPEAILNGHRAQRLANTLNVSFPGLDGEGLLMNLDLEGVCASSGSACMVGSIQPSHVLLAMGVPENIAGATVRFSLGKQTTVEEIEATIAAVERTTARLNPEVARA
jgi:cysteine desulfurase